jgi:hypothetical protein
MDEYHPLDREFWDFLRNMHVIRYPRGRLAVWESILRRYLKGALK